MKRSQICMFTMKSNNFARFGDHSVTCAEPHFCPTYDTIRPVLQWCDWLENLLAIFQFLLPISKPMIKFNSRIVRTHFANIMIWNYQEILAHMRSYISRWCSSCSLHCLCFKAPYYIVPTPWTLVVLWCQRAQGWDLRTGLVMMLFPQTRHFSPGCLSLSCCIDGKWQNTAAGYPWVWVAVCQKYTQLVHRRGSGITQSPAWIVQHHIVMFSSVSLLCFLLSHLFPGKPFFCTCSGQAVLFPWG